MKATGSTIHVAAAVRSVGRPRRASATTARLAINAIMIDSIDSTHRSSNYQQCEA